MSLCLGIYSRIPPPPRGTPKPLLATAMRGILPESVRTRPKSGFFNETVYRGLSSHRDALRRLVADSGQNES